MYKCFHLAKSKWQNWLSLFEKHISTAFDLITDYLPLCACVAVVCLVMCRHVPSHFMCAPRVYFQCQLSDELQQGGGPTDQLLHICDRGWGPSSAKPECIRGETVTRLWKGNCKELKRDLMKLLELYNKACFQAWIEQTWCHNYCWQDTDNC